MAQYRYIVQFQGTSGQPEDVFTNTLYANCVDNTAAMGFATRIGQAYLNPQGGGTTHAVADYYHQGVSRAPNAFTVRVYNLADPIPRVPIGTTTATLGPPIDTNLLPSEVALCLSFQAAAVSGGVQARRRGRIFLGPFNFGALTGTSTTLYDARPSVGLVTAAIDMAQFLMASTTAEWAVHSTLSSVLVPVDNGWVDNAFDTQRRRGARATARNAFTNLLP